MRRWTAVRPCSAAWLRWACVAVCASVAAGAAVPDVDAEAAKRKRCKGGQVKRTVTYAKRKGGHKRKVTGCGARSVTTQPSRAAVPLALRQARAMAVKQAPKRIARLRRGRAAKRVLRADGVTDSAIVGSLVGKLATLATLARAPKARSTSSVTTGSDNGPSDGAPQTPGTTTTMHRSGSEWSDASPDPGRGTTSTGSGPEQNPGFDATLTTETTSTRIHGAGSSMTKTIRIKVRMARCPDADGIGRGPVIYEEKSIESMDKPGGGRATITSISTYDGEVVAHFGDDAHIASVDLTGNWSYATTSRGPGGGSHRSTTGTSRDNRVGPGGRSLTVAVTTASDDTAAIGADPTGKWVAGIIPPTFAQDAVEGIARRALGGDCVHVTADPASAKLHAGGSKDFTAHLADSHGAGFTGRITTYVSSGSIAPTEAQAAPDATFRYTSLASRQPEDTDYVIFNHVSKRGKASGATVQIGYLPPVVSHTYRVMAAHFDEDVLGTRPGSSFPGCPDFSNREIGAMTLGPQAPPTGQPGTQGSLLDGGPGGFIGTIGAGGISAVTTTMLGCQLSTDPPSRCARGGAGTKTRDVSFQITLPRTGPAQLRWTFDFGPSAGIGSEGDAACVMPPIAATTTDFAKGDQAVPRSVFEAATPQDLAFSLDLNLTSLGFVPGQVHAIEKYSMTIQRVRDDGSPL